MKELKINKQKSELSIEKYENKLVASIARQSSLTKDELDELYDFGLLKLEECKNCLTEENFNRFSAWIIQQEIIKKGTTGFSVS